MQIFLHDDVAAAGEINIFVADKNEFADGLTPRILGAIDKSKQIAVIKVSKPMHLVRLRHYTSDARHYLRGKLEAHIHVVGANVKQQIAGGGNRVASAGSNFAEWVQLGGTR